ncbi:hypothetical protein [Aminicella lysinilytica]|uniref:Uncharacterized protein n=1 Tax=Aminicella lysinilytica TaxID=433323 RepID=A0A4R6Q618_9FIRM|nr:hypothetical protein [Aminicella lysinilytica]TDP56459.1 hypothetical protein EV211_11433 [Aminicella lysinilytica]
MKYKGWILLIGSIVCGIVVGYLLGAIADSVDVLYIGGFVGFMAPPIVYFGNRS